MKKPPRKKLFYKFLLFTLPFIAASIVATGLILSLNNFRYFKKTILQDYENILKSSTGEIRIFMEHSLRDLESLGWVLEAIKPDLWHQEMALVAFNHINSKFLSITLVDAGGKTLATTGWEEDGETGVEKALLDDAFSGKKSVSKVGLTKERLPFVHAAVPVSVAGDVEKVLWAAVDLKHVWDVLNGIKIGQSGQIFIMDLSGHTVAHQKMDKVVAPKPLGQLEIIDRIKASMNPVSWIEKNENQRLFCIGTHVSDFDWIVVLQQPMPEIYVHLFENIYWAVLITAVISLLTIIFGWYGIKRFLVPVERLHRQVQTIGMGDLDHKVTITTRDEIGELGNAFNQMTDDLKKRIEKEIATAKELAHARNLAVLGTTTSKVTHEVGNLLNNMGMSLLVFKAEALSDKGEKSLVLMEKESQRIRGFIGNVLKFAKKPDLNLSPVSLDLVVKEVFAAHATNAKEHRIKLELVWLEEIPKVNADSGLMYQVFGNLVKNSLEAMSGDGFIRIKGQTEDEDLVVLVEDSGDGIPSEHLEQIFDPFFTTKGKKGTGLGMAIVQTIVTAHRGTITCESETGQGTRFVLRLPYR